MTREQRFRYEMFVRVRDFGAAHQDLFPESSTGSQTFARVTAAVAAIDEYQKNHVLGLAEARRVKAATRAAVFDYMKAIAQAARRVTRPEPGENPFRLPRRRTLARELATARAFIEEAAGRQDAFVRFGLPPGFISEFRALVDQLQQAVDVRLSSKTVRRHARAGIETAVSDGLDAVRDLDVVVTLATRQDPTRFAAWHAARHIEGQGGQGTSTAGTAKPAALTPVAGPPVADVPVAAPSTPSPADSPVPAEPATPAVAPQPAAAEVSTTHAPDALRRVS